VFPVISALDQWPSWNPDVKSVSVEGPVQPGTVFRWKAGPSSLTSTLQVVDAPREIAWTGTTMGIKAVHVFRFQASDGGTLARSKESWEGLLPSMLKGYSRQTLDKGIRSVLAYLKAEAERRAATA
jgi:polyketide cyclase/dehydrase/lipid transport protein